MTIRREMNSKLGGFDPTSFLYSEETDFYFQLREGDDESSAWRKRRGYRAIRETSKSRLSARAERK
jgi:GT2 family glycosyltransferase